MTWRDRIPRMPSREQMATTGEMYHGSLAKAIVLVGIAVLMALPPIFVNHPIGYIPLIAYVLMLVMCFIYLRLIVRGFSVEHSFVESSCTRGNSIELPIVLKNESRLPILRARPRVYVKSPYGEVEREVLAIAMVDAKSDDRMNVNVQLGHMGVYTAGLQGVMLHDPLMVFQAYKHIEEEAQLTSLPRDVQVGVVEFSDMAVHESHAPIRTVISDNVDYAGTREYEYGDPMKSVHWKLSARTGDLYTRIFEASVNTKLSVVMDFHAPEYEADDQLSCSDAIVEMALAVMRQAVRRRIEAKLCYVDKNGATVTRALPQTGELESFVNSLPLLSPQVNGKDARDLAEQEVQRFGGSDSIVYCTSALSRELVASVTQMRAGHHSVTVILAVPAGSMRAFHQNDQGILTELSNAGVPCIVLSDAAELEQAGGHE